jgi:hypothetical protein
MKEMVEVEKEIENIVEKLKGYERAMAKKKGAFDLFGLFLRDEAPGTKRGLSNTLWTSCRRGYRKKK